MIMLTVVYVAIASYLLSCLDAATRPNFIFIVTDDQDIYFDSVSVMSALLSNVRDAGITFNNGFVATPICCPSRTESLSGRYYHNIREADDSLNTCMHIAAEYNVVNNTNNLFYTFQNNGYLTGVFGKMTNDQQQFWCTPVEQGKKPSVGGFSRINSPCAENFYQQLYFDKYINGSYKLHNITKSPSNYLTSYVGNETVNWIKECITEHPDKPFMIWNGPHAPHAPATPAVWYADRFNNSIAPRTPNYNVQSLDKVDWIATNPILYGAAVDNIDQQYRDRQRSLLSVDDMIGDIFKLLGKYPEVLNNTYVLFSSDHGFHLGQWRVGLTKHLPYDSDMRVPLMMRGPGIKKGSSSDFVVGNVDIVPTFLSLANIEYDSNTYDGIDWSPFMVENDNDFVTPVVQTRDAFLSQYMSIGTKCISGCGAWIPEPDGSAFPGRTQSAPCYNDENQAWMMDENTVGNWRALRIINATDNLMYVEWYNLPLPKKTWNDTVFKDAYWTELYNVEDDPYQIYNMWNDISKEKQYEFRNMLREYGDCAGNTCHKF
eukprot:45784_1